MSNFFQKVTLFSLCVLVFSVLPQEAAAAALLKAPSNLGLVGYWSFNDATSTIATDFSGNKNSGTLTTFANPMTSVSGWTPQGKRGYALNFDGSSNYVVMPSTVNNSITNTITVSAWVKGVGSSFSANGSIVTEAFIADGNVRFSMTGNHSSGSGADKISVGFYDGTWHVVDSSSLTVSQWNHIVGVFDGTNIKVYVNGVMVNSGNPGASLPVGTEEWRIGRRWDSGSYFTGSIDEVRIYNRVLSDGEIGYLYKSGATRQRTQNSKVTDTGLKMYLTFNGIDISGFTAIDRSGNGNNGVLTAGPILIPGKIGQALFFDGVDDQVIVASPTMGSPASVTLAGWARVDAEPNGTSVYLLDVGENVTLEEDDFGTVRGTYLYGNCIWRSTSTNVGGVIGTGWHHYAYVVDSTLHKQTYYFDGAQVAQDSFTDAISWGDGCSISNTIVGGNGRQAIDNVRFYNRALSASEIQQLYASTKGTTVNKSRNTKGAQSGLVGLWSFDGPDTNSTTAFDRSGNANDGTFTNSPQKVVGRLGQAMFFNGTTNYINVADNPFDLTDLSISAWVKTTQTTANVVIASKGAAGDFQYGLGINHASDPNGAYFSVTDATASTAITATSTSAVVVNDGAWHHIIGTLSGTTMSLYVDGVYQGISLNTIGTRNTSGAANFRIGATGVPSSYFAGAIDEVRVYNRALSSTEAKQLYLLGR